MKYQKLWEGVVKAMPFMEYATDVEQVYEYLKMIDEVSLQNAINVTVMENKLYLATHILETPTENDSHHLNGKISAALELILGGKVS